MAEEPKIFITGDTHGEIDIDKLTSRRWPEGKTLMKNDCLIIAGDFGLVFTPNGSKTEEFWLNWLEQRPWTTLFIDGNHENFPRLYSYPEEERFGGVVGVIRPSVLHLKTRGHVYEAAGKKIWCFGGAESVDKAYRKEGRSWWPEEEPTWEQMEYGLSQIEKYGGEFDFIVTHDCPARMLRTCLGGFGIYDGSSKIRPGRAGEYLERVADLARAQYWFFGHYHTDLSAEIDSQRYRALYCDIVRIF